MRLKNKLADIFHKPDKQERLVQAALLVVFLILVAGAGLGISAYKNHTEAGEETVTITKDEVSSDVKEYLAAYVVSDGFINTISSDQNLQDQLLAKLESGTSKLTQEQIQKIVDTASAQYQILSELDINELDEEQIRALEAAIYQNVKGLMPEDAAEDIEIIANGVSAIIEQNMIRQLEAMDASIEALQQEIAAIKNNILGSENLKELNDALAGMTGDIDAINTYVAGLKTSLEAEDEKLNRDIQDISSDLDNLHTYCDETATVLIKVRAYMDSINNSSVTNLSQNVDEMYKILETAGMSIEKLSNKILVIENSLKELSKSTDISGLLQELASLKNNVNNASSSLNSFKSELENNRSKTNELISNLKAEDISLLNKIEALNKTFTTLQAQAQDSINKLISQLNTANKNISSLQDTAKGALSDISSLQNITKGALEEIASILKDIDDIRARLEELEREKHIIIEIVNSLTVDDSSKALSAAMGYQLELEIQALRSDLEQSVQNLQAEIKNIEVTINNITNAELDGSLQAQIDALRKQVNDCFIYVSSGKKDLASALADKGVKVDAKAEFSEFVKGIQKIGANTTAKESHILEGYIAYGNNKYLTGTMPNMGQ